ADLIVAIVDQPSIGVGMELAFAFCGKKNIVLMHQKKSKISRMVLGIPNIMIINHDFNIDSFKDELVKFLFKKQNILI
ncbi:hypothetical protein KKF91_22375, partial [Myxococcota bacterium]|nr:hypothetical protein [Myxococcota bacterium]